MAKRREPEMRLFIIQPAHYKGIGTNRIHRTKKRTVVSLTLPYLASLVPPGWQVKIIDEQLTGIDFDEPVDVVALSAWTINSFRAYEIAGVYRKKNIPVLIGGPHTFFYADEASQHCDAVAIGEGELIFARMLEDAANARLQKFYRADEYHDLKHLSFPRYDLLEMNRYGFVKTFSVQTSRGCPFKCEFCSERFYLGEKYRFRPVEEVIEEINRTGAKNIFFADSNFAGNLSHTMALLEALIPLKLRWSTLWSAHLCKNREFMDLAKRSGLLHVNIGMESIDQKTLTEMNKKANRVAEYSEILDNLRKRDISYSLNFIFGFESETMTVFDATLTFLKEHKVPVAYFNVLTPHKGTPLYDRMVKEGKVIDAHNIGRWPGNNCYIKPAHCLPGELEQRISRMYRDFYNFPSMISRLQIPTSKARIASWIVNFSQRSMCSAENGAENFDNF